MKSFHYKGRKFVYSEEGSDKSEPFLFIHGWGVSPYTYKDSIKALSKHFHVYAPYLRGVDDLQVSSKVLAEFMDYLQIEKAVVLGHSFSGLIAAALAYYYPKKVKAVVLVDTVGIDFGRSNLGWGTTWARHVFSLLVGKYRHSGKFMTRLTLDFTYHVVRYPKELFAELKLMLRADISGMIADIKAPILVMRGNDDILVPKEVGEKICQLNKGAVLKSMPGGHNWSKIDVEALAREAVNFTKGI